jgi:hypothetical protein
MTGSFALMAASVALIWDIWILLRSLNYIHGFKRPKDE